MSPKSAALQRHDSPSLPGSSPAGSDAGDSSALAPRRSAHLSLVSPVDVDRSPAVETPRRRRRIVSALGVVVVIGVIIGLAVLPGDTPAPAPASRHAQPTQPAGDAQRRPTAPVTTAPATEPKDEPHAEDEPRTPAATPTSQGAQPTSSGTEDTTPRASGADPEPGPASTAPVAPPGTQAPANPTPPPTSPPATQPPATTPPPVTADGVVNGCNTYGENCGDNPLYAEVPPEGYDYASFPQVTTVANGTTLTARCWALGGVTYNYAAWFDPPDLGPNPYESAVVFNVRVPGGDQWAWLPDTWFVRDKNGRMGLPEC